MFTNIIVAFEAEEYRTRISGMLESGGINVKNTCRTGAEVIRTVNKKDGGLIICGFKFKDMTVADLAEDLYGSAIFLAVASPSYLEYYEHENVFKLPTPVSKNDLLASVRMLIQIEQKYHKRSVPDREPEEEKLITRAKAFLIDRNLMTEKEAHRFLQKKSMDAGLKMAETARIIINTGGQTVLMPDFSLHRKE